MILSQFKEVNNTSNFNIYEIIELQEQEHSYIKSVLDKVNTKDRKTSLIFFERETQELPYCYLGNIVSESIISNEKINEEMDTSSITLVHQGDIGFNDLLPNNTKVLLCEDVNVDEVIVDGAVRLSVLFQFDSKGRPTNHSQFVISGGANNQDKNELIVTQYGLVEPTAILRNAFTGTNSHTNMTKTTIYTIDENGNSVENVFTKDPTNLYAMIERQLKITGWKTSVEDKTWWKKVFISNSTKKFLSQVGVGASESFNSATLYDTFFKLGKYCKRYPVLYFNKNYRGDADTESFPQSKEFMLVFEKYDGSDKSTYQYDDIANNICGNLSITNNTNRMSSRVSCEVQNMASNNIVAYPSENAFIGLTGQISDLILNRDNAKNYTIKLPFPIFTVESVLTMAVSVYYEVGIENVVGDFYYENLNCILYDEWVLLDTEAKEKTAYYMQQGDKEIYVAHLKAVKSLSDSDDKAGAIFRIYYQPLINSRIEKGNIDNFSDIINQTDSNVDSSLWGSFMQNYSNQQKNYDVFFEMAHDKLSDSLEIGGNIIKDNQKLIIVDKKIKINKSNVFVSYGCNYNIPKRSELVNASNYIQKNYIDSSQAFERNSFIKIKRYLDIIFSDDKNNLSSYIIDNSYLFPNFSNLENKKIKTTLLKINIDSRDGNNYVYDNFGEITNELYIKTGVYYFTFANSIGINFVGNTNKLWKIVGGFLANKDYTFTQKPLTYTDYFGNIKNISIYYSNIDDKSEKVLEDYNNLSVSGTNYNLAYDLIESMGETITSDWVISEEDKQNYISSSIISIEDFVLLKDTNEILNFTFQIDIDSAKPDIIVYHNFINKSQLISDYIIDTNSTMELIDITEEEIEEFTQEFDSTNLNKVVITFENSTNNNLLVKFSDFTLQENKKYCIAVTTNNISIPFVSFVANANIIANAPFSNYNRLYVTLKNEKEN